MKQQLQHSPAIMFCGIALPIVFLGMLLLVGWCESIGQCASVAGESKISEVLHDRPNAAMHSAINHALFRGASTKGQLPTISKDICKDVGNDVLVYSALHRHESR
jgi:hypothetical protein